MDISEVNIRKHIRSRHDSTFPKLPSHHNGYTITTETGNVVYFNNGKKKKKKKGKYYHTL